MPRPTDPYVWKYLPVREHLFRKQLSKHNSGAYREISRELGHSIEVTRQHHYHTSYTASQSCHQQEPAIPQPDSHEALDPRLFSDQPCNHPSELSDIDVPSYEQSFTQSIHILEKENCTLKSQLTASELLANERLQTIDCMQVNYMAVTENVRQLRSTLEVKNIQEGQRAQRLEAYESKVKELEPSLRLWARKLQALQDDLATSSSTLMVFESPPTGAVL